MLHRVPEAPGAHAARICQSAFQLPISLLLFHAPRSYTGQDAAEILLPGNPHLVSRVLERLIAAGARQAEPGEFTARAYLAGKMPLDRAEAVAQLIAADRDADLDAAARLLEGKTGETYRNWTDRLAALLALVEAGIDFTDQDDVVPIAPADLAGALRALLTEIEAHTGGGSATERRTSEPRVVLVGPPNAGKSTLFNALLGRRRAVTSETPGTTRDVLDEPLDLSDQHPGADVVRLLDLPGLDRHASSAPDRAAQRHAIDAIRSAAVLVCCDPAGRFDAHRPDSSAAVISVRTKADLHLCSTDDAQFAVCALDGWRLDALRRAIADIALNPPGGEAVVPRHRRALVRAADSCRVALSSFDPEALVFEEPEILADPLRVALDSLGSVCGRVPPDDVIGRIFASFCVGK